LTPILFGDSDAPLFGVLHEPEASRARDHGVLLCPPIAQEYVRSHWAMRQLALSLQRAGFPCLRFDWYGVGDSSGELHRASLARWRSDAASGAQELRDASGVRRVSLVGLRIGGAIALSAARDVKPANLVLWDPVLDGRTYLAELEAMHGALTSDVKRYWLPVRRPKTSPAELVGFDLGVELRREIEGIGAPVVAGAADLGGARVCLVDSISSPALAALEKRLRGVLVDVERRTTTLAASWSDAALVEELLLPGDAIPRVTDFLEARAT
jgi:pimeloyl-ACP methyl ester carboxylesterase